MKREGQINSPLVYCRAIWLSENASAICNQQKCVPSTGEKQTK
jgi:hypothetical protein